jgi:hypothetical protein
MKYSNFIFYITQSMKIFRFFLLFLILCSAVFAEEKNNNQKVAIYLHPMLTFGLLPKDIPLMVQLTSEIPLSKFNSLIIDPSLVMWERDSGRNIFNLGTGVGIRHFLSKKANSFYLQPMVSAHYLKIKEVNALLYYDGSTWKTKDYRGINTGASVDILGYFGYSAKYSSICVFHDVGLGYGWSNVHNNDENSGVSMLGQSNGISIDINLGIGIPF